MLGPRVERDVLDERSAERDVQDLDPAAHAEDRQAAVERPLDELELEGVALRVGRREKLVRLLAVRRRLDVAAAAEEDAVAGVEHLSGGRRAGKGEAERRRPARRGRWKPTPA